MEFEQRGYETFKEHAAEARPISQNLLTTIEFGFSPFVPFSQDFIMYHGSIGQTGFGVHVSSKPGAEGAENWKTRIAEYGDARMGAQQRPSDYIPSPDAGTDAVLADIYDAPKAGMKTEAEILSKRITRMLEQEGIAAEYDTKVREEIEGRAVGKMLLDTFGASGEWREHSVDEQIELVSGQMRNLGKGFDLYPDTQDNADVLEYNLHMIARQLGPRGHVFVRGVRAMETTTESASKYWQILMRESAQAGVDIATQWSNAVNKGVDQLKDMIYVSVGGGSRFEDYYNMIGEQKLNGHETLAYFARQMLARFAEIENGQMFLSAGMGQFGDAYIFEAPLGGKHLSAAHVGLARIEPIIEDGYLTNILVDTAIMGGEAFEALAIAGEKEGAFEKFANTSWAGNAQLLLWDYQELTRRSHAETIAMAIEGYAKIPNTLALMSGRGDILGDGLKIEMEVGLGNTVMSGYRVQAVEVIGSKEARDIIEKQINAFFRDPNVGKQFEKFYKAAMKGSEDLTTSWKGMIGSENQTVGAGSIYANADKLFTDEHHLAGIGIPFWFMLGRDPTGFKKFKDTETHSVAKFKKENTVAAGKQQGVQMQTGALKGEYLAVRDPRNYQLTKTWSGGKRSTIAEPRGRKHTRYMAQGWRADLDAEFGKAGVLYDDMSEVKDILSRPRLGGVQQNRDKRSGQYLTGFTSPIGNS